MEKSPPCYYVLEIPTEGIIAGQKATARVRGCHASILTAAEQAKALHDERHALCCYRYQVLSRTMAEKRYTLEA